MQGWHTTFLGMRGLPRDISDFEMKAFFTFDGAERDAINARRGDSHKLGLALHIGFLRMSGRLLGAFRVIPVALWRHLGNELGIAAPEVASLRAMYGVSLDIENYCTIRTSPACQSRYLWFLSALQ
ncbi:DUF4158 domain-containing protein [Escherichia coli]|nr:DUF4158 domain-containing protein [Escherichia coli]